MIDIERLVSKMKESELKKSLGAIAEYSCFVKLEQAHEVQRVKDYQKDVAATFHPDYGKMLSTFNGGMLFSTKVYGIEVDDGVMDLGKQNKYLHESNSVPSDMLAIAEEDYGDFICMKRNGSSAEVFAFGIDDSGILACICTWNSIYEWLDDELVAGEELIATDNLDPYMQ